MATTVASAKKKDPLAGLKCPISGKKVVAASATKYKDGEVYFCCTNCPKAFAKDTAKFAAKANHQLVASGQYKQEKCPVAGKALNPATAIKVGDTEVQFCCNGCKGKAKKASDQVDFVFNDKAFAKGFVAVKP